MTDVWFRNKCLVSEQRLDLWLVIKLADQIAAASFFAIFILYTNED